MDYERVQNIAGTFDFNRELLEILETIRIVNCYLRNKKGRCKYWSSIVLLESGTTPEKAKFRFFRKKSVSFTFKFLLEVSFRYQFQGFMLKEHL